MTSHKRSVVILVSLCVLLLGQHGGRAQPLATDALKFFKNYFVTGNYVVGGVGLWGRSSGTITMPSLPSPQAPPDGAEALAAFLYWQVVSSEPSNVFALQGSFNLQPLLTPPGAPDAGSLVGAQLSPIVGLGGTAPCQLSGGGAGRQVYTFRADVLPFLDVDAVSGRHRITGDYNVALPNNGTLTRTLGASLVVIYRDPRPTTPLSAVVMYDGVFTKQQQQMMSQRIKGFYDPAAVPGQITYIAGSAQSYLAERLTGPFAPEDDPFDGALGNAWDNVTRTTNSLAGASFFDTTIAPRLTGFASIFNDCITLGAIVYRTEVNDTDGDGLLNRWETATSASPLLDPNGEALPTLGDMGADPNVKDLFVEVGYMKTDPLTSPDLAAGVRYGGDLKLHHSHRPTPAALKKLGDAFWCAGTAGCDPKINAPDTRIQVHFDAGRQSATFSGDVVDPYPTYLGADAYAERYIIRDTTPGLARGGEAIDEMFTVCDRSVGALPSVCQFSDSPPFSFPGTVGWKTGFQFLRDGFLFRPVGFEAPTPTADIPNPADPCEAPFSGCVRLFDRNRKDMFRYAFFAHAVGLPQSEFACLDSTATDAAGHPTGNPVPDIGGSCAVAPNPAYHTPRRNSGIADFPGRDLMVTLGGFLDAASLPVGTPHMQGSTLMHELGHTFDLTHAGIPLVPPEPNCKPNYLSVMNYLFQLRGLFDDVHPGVTLMDFSGEVLDGLNEPALFNGSLSGGIPRYHTGWYAPLGASGSAATAYCNGSSFDPLHLPPAMIRVDSASVPSVGNTIDWNPNSLSEGEPQDINFDGSTQPLNAGSNDWLSIRLNQLGSSRNVQGFSLDVGSKDLGSKDLGSKDLGSKDLGSKDLGSKDLGSKDLGSKDLGSKDLGEADEPTSDTFLAAGGANGPPAEVQACVIGLGLGKCFGLPVPPFDPQFHRIRVDWKVPSAFVSPPLSYDVYRVGRTAPVASVAAVLGQEEYSVVDFDELTDGAPYTYYAIAEYPDGPDADSLNDLSDHSNHVLITAAVNDAPAAEGQSVALNEDLTPDPPAFATPPTAPPTIALNATDDDSAGPLTYSITSIPAHGTLSCGACSGDVSPSVTYTPVPNYFGSDSFTFKANDKRLVYNPAGRDSNVATVSITVNAVNDAPTFLKGPDQTVNQDAAAVERTGTPSPWATAITKAGPLNAFPPAEPSSESDQAVDFIVAITSADPTLVFSVPPLISSTGILTYTPAAGAYGVANLTVQIHDNGLTAHNGKDTSATQSFKITVVPTKKLTVASPAEVWMGLKNSADVGTKFDLRVEVLKNDTVVASAIVSNVTLGSYASATYRTTKAVFKKIDLSAIAAPGVPFGAGDAMKLKVSVRIGSASSHSNAKATLWYNLNGTDDDSSHLDAKIGGVSDRYFLVSGFVLKKTSPGSGLTPQSVDVIVSTLDPIGADGTKFKPFGTWIITPVP